MPGSAGWSSYAEIVLVVVAAIVGLVAGAPGRALDDRGAINVALFVLVFTAAMTLPATALRDVRAQWRGLAMVVGVSTVCLPPLAWIAAQLVPEGPARLGVLAIGVAPAEIATVALVGLAGGEIAAAGALLLASTGVTVVVTAPVLSILSSSSGTAVHVSELVITLVLVVVLPFILGALVGRRVPNLATGAAARVPSVAVAVLVWLVASQVSLDRSYVRIGVALLVLLLGSAALGSLLGRAVAVPARSAVLLGVSMRDFAVASGIAAAAFSPAAAAPLGLYGVMVMVWGTVAATTWRSRR